MKTLVIDDLRRAYEDADVTYARTPEEGVRLLTEEDWELVCLDHDMGYELYNFNELTIWPCIEYIEQNVDKFKDVIFYIITSSPVGGDRMEAALNQLNLEYYRIGWKEKADLFTGG